MSWIKSIDEVGSGDRISVGKIIKGVKKILSEVLALGLVEALTVK